MSLPWTGLRDGGEGSLSTVGEATGAAEQLRQWSRTPDKGEGPLPWMWLRGHWSCLRNGRCHGTMGAVTVMEKSTGKAVGSTQWFGNNEVVSTVDVVAGP